MPDVVRPSPILFTEIVRVCRKASRAIGIALCLAESVVHIETDVATQTAAEGHDKLILIEATGGIVFKVIVDAERTGPTARDIWIESSRQRCIDRTRAQ